MLQKPSSTLSLIVLMENVYKRLTVIQIDTNIIIMTPNLFINYKIKKQFKILQNKLFDFFPSTKW